MLGEDEAAASKDPPSPDDTASRNGALTKPVGSALMSVFQRMRQETIDEEYMTMSPQIEESQSDSAHLQRKLGCEKISPRYVLGHPPLQLSSEESETPRHTPPACSQVEMTEEQEESEIPKHTPPACSQVEMTEE